MWDRGPQCPKCALGSLSSRDCPATPLGEGCILTLWPLVRGQFLMDGSQTRPQGAPQLTHRARQIVCLQQGHTLALGPAVKAAVNGDRRMTQGGTSGEWTLAPTWGPTGRLLKEAGMEEGVTCVPRTWKEARERPLVSLSTPWVPPQGRCPQKHRAAPWSPFPNSSEDQPHSTTQGMRGLGLAEPSPQESPESRCPGWLRAELQGALATGRSQSVLPTHTGAHPFLKPGSVDFSA